MAPKGLWASSDDVRAWGAPGMEEEELGEAPEPAGPHLELRIISTCLGVSAKMHGLSCSFSALCGTEHTWVRQPSLTEATPFT